MSLPKEHQDASPGNASSLGDMAYACIRKDILACRLAPGSTVTEPMLMADYGIGKNSCRIALVRLCHDGLVISRPRKGYFIKEITLKDVDEIFTLRAQIEPLAARLAVGKVDIDELRRLEKACRRKHPVPLPKQIDVFMDANKLFHLEIARAAGNVRLLTILESLMDEMSRLVALGFNVQGTKPEIKHDHEAMIEAFVEKDARRVETIARKHIETFQEMTHAHLYSTLTEAGTALPLLDKRLFG